VADNIKEYDIGDEILLRVTFRDLAGALADPSGEITLNYEPTPGGALVTEIYNNGAGNVVRASAGIYQFAFTTTAAGRHRFSYTSAGDLVQFEEGSWWVRERMIAVA